MKNKGFQEAQQEPTSEANSVFQRLARVKTQEYWSLEFNLSKGYFSKWCRPIASDENPEACGIRSPLAVIGQMLSESALIDSVETGKVMDWLADKAHGLFVPLPTTAIHRDEDLFAALGKINGRLGSLQMSIAKSLDDGRLDLGELADLLDGVRGLLSDVVTLKWVLRARARRDNR